MPVRIEDTLYEQAKTDAMVEHRTIAGQIEFWAKVGRAALDNPDLPASFIAESLIAPGTRYPIRSEDMPHVTDQVEQTRRSARQYKKLQDNVVVDVDDAIGIIAANPVAGERKKQLS
ncbi:hypothetical protein DFQ28_011567 [Apophysomyces sp. BC1034]|nr:hypothetical protein DFQ28_011567 [Apophysomyces sp. BC1034]